MLKAGDTASPMALALPDAGKGGEPGMKKTMNKQSLVKESVLWERMKDALSKRPATTCHK
ncbi:MAG TPA: hypothetical protein VN604_12020 [Nitrospirota bacterium]|nr:hypothetical protein [Nitrospirota bacterium]